MKWVRAAGGIVWRSTAAGPRIALVHRTRRDDWTLPKGKLDPGEGWQDAARREIAEETGCEVRLGRFAGAKLYVDRPQPKLVLYWHARLIREGTLRCAEEIDDVAWLSRREALERLDHASDRRLLLRALGASRVEPWRTDRSAGTALRARPEDLERLVVLDSRKAGDELPSILPLVAEVAAAGARASRARRA